MIFNQFLHSNFTELIIKLSIVIGALWVIYEKMIKPSFALFKKIRSTTDIIEKIYNEFKPNGGSSMRDSINRLENDIKNLNHFKFAILNTDERPIFLTDENGKYIFANLSYLTLADRELDEVLSSGWMNNVKLTERTIVYNEWNNAIKDKRNFELQYTFINRAGNEYNVHSVALVNKDAGYFGLLKIKK